MNVSWISFVVAAMVGATVAGASSYVLHYRAMERHQQRLEDRRALRRKGHRRNGMFSPGEAPAACLEPSLDAKALDSISSIPPGLPRVQIRKEGPVLSNSYFICV